ncbi:MAG: hypothetical protein SFY95_06360 [Planctomycetota bacterium]|nr:hypothetical protein [Planctomycetota bacterium]
MTTTTNSGWTGGDRRNGGRTTADRPGKVFHRESRLFLPARIMDTSDGGALIRMEPGWTGRSISAGDCVDVLVAWNAHGVAHTGSLLGATVVRSMTGPDGATYLGVSYARASGDGLTGDGLEGAAA